MHPMKVCDIIMCILWAVVGAIALFSEHVSKFTFIVLLICYLGEMALKILLNRYDDNDKDDKPKLA